MVQIKLLRNLLFSDVLLQILRRGQVLGHVVVGADNEHRGVRSPGLDVHQPLQDLSNASRTVGDFPHDEIQTSLGQEVLVSGIVFSLASEVPSPN